jgi:glycosyltransferase involved in cell wall biosynthesis
MNRPDSLIRLVTSLQLQNIAPESYEVLVIYNTESDQKNSPLHAHPKCKVLCAPKPGVNHARNHGALHASGDLILFLDDDCEVTDPLFLQKHIDYHNKHKDLVAIGGPYFLKPKASVFDQIYQQNNLNWISANLTEPTRSSALLGGNASYKSFLFQKGYRFTEEIMYGGSETPLNTLLSLKYGSHGYFMDLQVLHNTQLNFFNLLYKAFRQGAGAALQTKIYGHQLKQVAINTTTQSFLVNMGLEFYAFIFTVSYQAHLSSRNFVWTFFATLWDRYIHKKMILKLKFQLMRMYWWQHARLRHPLLAFASKTYWSFHSFSSKTYWSIYPHIYGFVETLFEPLPLAPQTSAAQRLVRRWIHITRKMGWLFLRTVRLK